MTQSTLSQESKAISLKGAGSSSSAGTSYRAWVAKAPKQPMTVETINPGPLGPEEVEVAVEYCGLCHSDLSVLNNDWGITQYPVVLGHEAIGRITALGSNAKGLAVGQRVGVGWASKSCMHCYQCLSGSHNLCPEVEFTIVGRNGAFASHVRSHWAWAFPLPEELDPADAGPLLCGGATVFAPLAMYGKTAQRVGVVGIGGLGHLAVKFAAALGSDVTALTSSERKFEEARGFGANHVLASSDSAGLQKSAGQLDLLICTVNVALDWEAIIGLLAPNGRLHIVGAVPTAIPVSVFSLMMKQRSISSSPSGSPAVIRTMLEFAARHRIAPQTEHFPMSKIHDAFARLQAGKAHYRIVLDADF